MIRGAELSNCGRYRHALWRIWDENKQHLVFCMLNPSTADAEEDDPTIRKCVGFATRAGYGGIVVVNLFDWRATDPKELTADKELLGPRRLSLCDRMGGQDVVLAWGANARRFPERAAWVTSMARICAGRVFHIKLLDDGVPAHPLMLPYSLPLTEMRQ